MKVLLIGEFSRLHNSLKEGLISLGHQVTIVGTGDNFKNYPIDISIAPRITTSNFIFRFLNKCFDKFFKINFEAIEKGIRFYLLLPNLKNYDVVQLINSDAIETNPKWQINFYNKLFKNNKKSFLLICGDETPIVDFNLKNQLKYSVLTPYLENKKLKNLYQYSLKYVTKNYRELYEFIEKKCDGIIVSDIDYKIPMMQTKTNVVLIPNPINTDKIKYFENLINDKIIIFHGINELSHIKKGNIFFEKALGIIQEKYPEKVEIITTRSIPYNQYIELYNKAHIVLDMVYAYDQGYNALEAMAKGKVVFTGAETEFEAFYNLKESVNINAKPDVDYLVNELSFLIENPQEIIEIGKRARIFIEKEHNYIKIAKKYLEVWQG